MKYLELLSDEENALMLLMDQAENTLDWQGIHFIGVNPLGTFSCSTRWGSRIIPISNNN